MDTAALDEDREKLLQHLPWFEAEARRLDHKLFQAIALRARAVVNRLDSKFKPARDQLAKAEGILKSLQTDWQSGRTAYEIGQLELAQKNYPEARRYFERAGQFYERLGAVPDFDRTRTKLESIPT